MDIFLYIIIFIMGTVFGSFYSLAIYRIPKKQDITHTHSYCPNCNHKLGFFDLIPILSYIFLFGKCRYCKEKIRPRYLILETVSGLLFVGLAYLMNIRINILTISKVVEYGFYVLFLTFLMLTIGIDKENRKIEKSVSNYGIVISIMYMLYLCIVGNASIYRYGIYTLYLILYIIVLIIDTITLRKFAKNSYVIGNIFILLTISIFTGEYVAITTVIYTLLVIALYILFYKIKQRHNKNKKTDMQVAQYISIGALMGITNIVICSLALIDKLIN